MAASSPAEAKAEFDRAVALDPNEVKARYFVGLAAEQDGRKDDAANVWRAMLASAPADAPWRPLIQDALTRVGVAAPKLSDEDVAAAKGMTEGDRNSMIRGMVDRLATRLKDNGDDVAGAGCGWCGPIWFSASATRRRRRAAMHVRRWATMPRGCSS